MGLETNLRELARVIGWIDRYHGYRFEDPMKINAAIETTNLSYLRRSWKKIREDVEKIYVQQKQLSDALNIFRIIREILIFASFTIYVLSMIFKVQVIQTWIGFPLVMITMVAIFTFPFFKHKMVKKIRENNKAHVERLQKIRNVTQDLIFYLCEKIMLEKQNPKKYKMKVSYPNYYGVLVVKKPGFFGREYYEVVPSVIGMITSKGRRYIRIVDPWAYDEETFISLAKAHPTVKIKMLTSKKTGENKRFQRACKKMDAVRPGKFDVAACDLSNLDSRVIIAPNRLWRTTERSWHTLVEVKDYGQKEALKKLFDEKWNAANPIL